MALHQLTSFTLGIPDPEETAAYYRQFGLADAGDGWFATRDGGRQLHLVTAPMRTGPVGPRKLGHVVIGTTDFDATTPGSRHGIVS